MKDGNESMRDKKFLVVTTKGQKDDVRFYLGMNDHEKISRDPYHLDRNFARDYDALLSLWTD